MSSASSQTLRRYVLTTSVAAITATGAWYGAGLKARQEFKEVRNASTYQLITRLTQVQEKRVALEATPAERIEQLEALKARHLVHKADLQSKIDRLTAKTTSTRPETHEQSG